MYTIIPNETITLDGQIFHIEAEKETRLGHNNEEIWKVRLQEFHGCHEYGANLTLLCKKLRKNAEILKVHILAGNTYTRYK